MCKSILKGQNVPGTDGTYHGTDGMCPRDRRDAHQGVSRQNSLCLLFFLCQVIWRSSKIFLSSQVSATRRSTEAVLSILGGMLLAHVGLQPMLPSHQCLETRLPPKMRRRLRSRQAFPTNTLVVTILQIIRSGPGKPKKGQFMNFSHGHSRTEVQCESCFFPKEKRQNSQKWANS